VLHEIMLSTSTTQSELSRLSGVRQPSISQFLSGKVRLSDEQLDRLLSCMGYQLEVVRRPVRPELTRSEWRSWRLHRQLSTHLTRPGLERWRPAIERNLERLRSTVQGKPHVRNLDKWESLLERSDISRLHRILTGLDRDSMSSEIDILPIADSNEETIRLGDRIEGVAGELSPFEELVPPQGRSLRCEVVRIPGKGPELCLRAA
jgi:transcriptional regulator with XRE-family HTH domain